MVFTMNNKQIYKLKRGCYTCEEDKMETHLFCDCGNCVLCGENECEDCEEDDEDEIWNECPKCLSESTSELCKIHNICNECWFDAIYKLIIYRENNKKN